jgi:calcineurin-like phosphoesterase family protein
MKFFTSDQHFGETRIGHQGQPDFFFRRHNFSSVEDQNQKLLHYINEVVGENDELIHLGDVAVNVESLSLLDGLKCKRRTLILGNYDIDKVTELEKYFDEIYDFGWFEVAKIPHAVYCNHYPSSCKEYLVNSDEKLTLTRHIHGLWMVREGMLNVGCDAWHYRPIGEDEIAFRYNAMVNIYDNNVF